MRIGDVTNLAVLMNTAAFLGVVIAHEFDKNLEWFNDSFVEEGFCVSWKETPYLSSHILCFYVDTVCAILLAYLARRYKKMQGSEPMTSAAAGVFVHGCAHLHTWSRTMDLQSDRDLKLATSPLHQDIPLLMRFVYATGGAVFFFFLLRAAPNVNTTMAFALAVPYGTILTTVVPPRFGFTFVQTSILWSCVAADMLFHPKKDMFYDLSAIMINLPVGLVSWLEATTCDSTLVHLGGHLWYDTSIPLSYFAYMVVALRHQPLVRDSKDVSKEV